MPLLASAVAGMLFIGLLAGFYPAVFLSRFQPVDVLKGETAPALRTS